MSRSSLGLETGMSGMKEFRVQMDAVFLANDIDYALALLGHHFMPPR
jgi:hypothetical protein